MYDLLRHTFCILNTVGNTVCVKIQTYLEELYKEYPVGKEQDIYSRIFKYCINTMCATPYNNLKKKKK